MKKIYKIQYSEGKFTYVNTTDEIITEPFSLQGKKIDETRFAGMPRTVEASWTNDGNRIK